jgi:phosphoribosylformylglycinamidine cyclo-ligase
LQPFFLFYIKCNFDCKYYRALSYEKRGVSAKKTEVHEAIKNLDKGLYPNAFCKVLPDVAAGDPEWCNIMHADTAGTKTSLAYMYWKETGNLDTWKGIVQDAIVMNLDDMACTGVVNNIMLSSTIGRNKNLVTGEALKALIEGTVEFIAKMQAQGIDLLLTGGETADVGDIVRTADVGFTAFARLPRKDILDINIKAGNVIVGFASYGQSTYEDKYNSGIGSNGLTFARHEALSHEYATKYPECFDPGLDKEVVFSGDMKLTEKTEDGLPDVGTLLLSPTRTFLPLIKKMLGSYREKLDGIIHCTGGGQTKVLHFIKNLHIIKNNLLPVPSVFKMIQSQKNCDWKEMYQVFNMGQRLEVYTDAETAQKLIEISNSFNIEAKVIGRVEGFSGKQLTLSTAHGEWVF